MLDFVIKYWVEFALGLVATGLGAFCRHLMKERKQYLALVKQEEKYGVINIKGNELFKKSGKC